MRNRILLIAGGSIIALVLLTVIVRGGGKKAETDSVANAARTSPQELYSQAVTLKQSNHSDKAKELFQEIITNYPDYEGVENVQKDLEDINMKLISTGMKSPRVVIHKVEPGDSLVKIAKKYNTTIELIRKRNNLSSSTIRPGQQLSIYAGDFSVFVDKSQNILILKDGHQIVKVYHVSTGANNSTPAGDFKITSKLVDPVWFKSGAIIPAESPQNELGTRWLGFDIAGYGIHGTNQPDMIGKQATAGCVRMLNREVEELFDILPVGTKVTVAD